MDVVSGTLLDVDYRTGEQASDIRVFVKTKKGIRCFFDHRFFPYFFVTAQDVARARRTLEAHVFEGGIAIKTVKIVDKAGTQALKLVFDKVEHLTRAREEIKEHFPEMKRFEYDVPFAQRYIIDNQLQPMAGVELKVEDKSIKSILPVSVGQAVKIGCFDIETTSLPGSFSNPRQDSAIMIAVGTKDTTRVFSFMDINEAFVCSFKTEKEVIDAFVEAVKNLRLDVLVTYNGDLFDLPYLKERARILGTALPLGADGSEPRGKQRGVDSAVRIVGMQHLDAYQLLRLLVRLGVVNLVKFDLESVVETLFGVEKEKVLPQEINHAWKTGTGLERVARYNKEDVEFTLKIAERYFPLVVELSKLTKRTVFDVCRASASMLVEDLLVDRAFKKNVLVNNRPREYEVKSRMAHSYTGGYVKEPVSGLHENICVLDFSSLYPTIMISHNISPETLKEEKTGENCSPNGYCFSQKNEGFVSGTLKELFSARTKIKKKLKTLDKKSTDYVFLDAQQHALKIIMNSFYGYFGYARSRWYSIECASAVTAWAREYVQEVAEKAAAAGFTVLYGDTDSCFLKIPKNKTKQDVVTFVKKINSELPGVMELELEGFFKRGIFVTKESGAGAKKKYALIDDNNHLKIAGFEYVRRDWSGIAKETQKAVITAILEEGAPEKAARIVQKVVAQLKEGTMPKEKLVVLTKIQRPLAKYESIGPHVAAARKAVARGKSVGAGSIIGYIITRTGKSISDRAELEEYVQEGNYDADYYIHHQVLPAVIKIMRELGYSKEDLEHGGKQQTLF